LRGRVVLVETRKDLGNLPLVTHMLTENQIFGLNSSILDRSAFAVENTTLIAIS
jgi:hypothetical protein